MVNRFINKWTEKEKEPSVLSKIKNAAQPSENLKDQISMVTQRIDVQTKTLDMAVKRFETRDADVFNRVVKALSQRDTARANILATELSEIRKVEKMLTHASIAMESISMRLKTVSEVGDLVTVLGPAANILKSVRCEMSTILPEASQELGNIGSLLSDIVSTTCQSPEAPVNTIMASADALQILEEAEVAAEKKLSEQFPEAATENTNQRTSIEA